MKTAISSGWTILVLLAMSKTSLGEDVCGNDSGKLSLISDDNSPHIYTLRNESSGEITVFVQSRPSYKFRCEHFTPLGEPRIVFGIDEDKLQNMFFNGSMYERLLFKNQLKNTLKGLNKHPVSVECNNVCSVNVIVIEIDQREHEICNLNGSLKCDIDDLNEVLPAPRSNLGSSVFEPVITYSIFDPVNGSWVKCDEYDDDDELVQAGINLEGHTDEIRCPIDLTSGEPRPVIIRIEEKTNSKCGVGLPSLCDNPSEPKYSYMSALVSQDDLKTDLGKSYKQEHWRQKLIMVVSIVVSLIVLVVALLSIIGWMCYRKYKKGKAKALHPTFYVNDAPNGDCAKSIMASAFSDTVSMRTESTGLANNYLEMTRVNIVSDDDLFDHDDEHDSHGSWKFSDNTEEGMKARKKIISRQLSGDPTKLNPDMFLNQQAKVLPYNPVYEIDKSNFSTVKILGSGNFGSVFEGNAIGLFHPGSQTKVAIKMTIDSQNVEQLTALLCEIKILANLDLHLNLVNMLGACTTELHNRELYLLLEFCSNGDMKSFIISHREDFKASLANKIAVNNLDERIFFKWSHSIAKGMEYLSSKRIMHGDLAARNILIGDNYVAKVSDFGLSKTFYDNIRYKKQARQDVPWKWMALEYLQDGCFTMRSDVWSYGIVLWEILSLGQEPYAGKNIESTISEIKKGYRLPCPTDLMDDTDWVEDVYEKVTYGCWQESPGARYSFSDIVTILETYLSQGELQQYSDLSEEYVTMKALMCDDMTRSKRILSQPHLNSNQDNTSYHKLHVVQDEQPPEMATNNMQASNGYLSIQDVISNPSSTPDVESGNYITVTQAMS